MGNMIIEDREGNELGRTEDISGDFVTLRLDLDKLAQLLGIKHRVPVLDVPHRRDEAEKDVDEDEDAGQ